MVFVAGAAVITAQTGEDDVQKGDYEMFLCLDDSIVNPPDGSPPKKLVYGYVDGQRTSCMPEYELLALLSKRHFEQNKQQRNEALGIGKNAAPSGNGAMGKNLAFADLSGSDLSNVDLSNADLRGADMSGADMRGCNLSGANLTGARLCGAYLRKANFKGADITKADFTGAYCNEANMYQVQGLTMEILGAIYNLHNAKLDYEWMEQVKEYFKRKLKDPGWRWETNAWTQSDEDKKSKK